MLNLVEECLIRINVIKRRVLKQFRQIIRIFVPEFKKRKQTMKKLIRLVMAVTLISGLTLFPSCSNGDNAAQKDGTPVRIGIAWRGDSTSISYTSTLQSVREAGAVPVPLPLLKSPFMEYDSALCYFSALITLKSK